jgi:hypothetical protein
LRPALLACVIIHNFRNGLEHHAADVPRHAFAVSDAHHQDALAGKL